MVALRNVRRETRAPLLLRRERGERVVDLVPSAKHRTLIRERGLLLLCLTQLQLGTQSSAFEDRQAERRADREGG